MIDRYMDELAAALSVRGAVRRRFLRECRDHLDDAAAGFDATLQGQSCQPPTPPGACTGVGTGTWIDGNLLNWRELDAIPTRVLLEGGPVTGQVITVAGGMEGRLLHPPGAPSR